MFSYEIFEIFKNTYYHRTPLMAASVPLQFQYNNIQTLIFVKPSLQCVLKCYERLFHHIGYIETGLFYPIELYVN